jgi:Cysteine dioxygenase type I
MSVEISNEDRQKRALREITKTFCGIEKPLKNYIDRIDSLNDLIRELYVVFASDYVNIEKVNHLMMIYTSNYNDWKKFGMLKNILN